MAKKVSISKGVFVDFPRELFKEARYQIFGGRPKKKKKKGGGSSIHVHYHFEKGKSWSDSIGNPKIRRR